MSPQEPIVPPLPPSPPVHEEKAWWPLALGLVLVALGFSAFYKIWTGADQNQIMIGVLMLIGGVAQGFYAVFGRHWRNFLAEMAPAILYLLGGMIIIADPLTGSFVLTVLLATTLVVGAVYRIALSFREGLFKGWQIAAVAFGISAALWLWLLWAWPKSGLWVLGTIVGVELVASGIAWIQRGITERKTGAEV
jgi:uncharacterized membrane protein HdeD (DUF308 family)